MFICKASAFKICINEGIEERGVHIYMLTSISLLSIDLMKYLNIKHDPRLIFCVIYGRKLKKPLSAFYLQKELDDARSLVSYQIKMALVNDDLLSRIKQRKRCHILFQKQNIKK